MAVAHLIPGAAARSRNVRNCGRAGHVPGVYPGQEEIMEKQLTEQADHLEKENRSGETGVETGVFRPSDSAATAGSQEEFDQDRAQGAASPSAGDGSRTDADLESYPGVGHVRIRHLESRLPAFCRRHHWHPYRRSAQSAQETPRSIHQEQMVDAASKSYS